MFALFYQQVGTILSYTGAISGFLIIYVLPVMIHMKRLRTSIENPLLAEALNETGLTLKRNLISRHKSR
jgi:hypothetical protein